MIYKGLGENEKSPDWSGEPKTAFLKIEPKLDNFRREPRFIDLIKRMNIE
jgi:hypothetical protein